MGMILHRLERGEPWWPVEIILRLSGLCLFGPCIALTSWLSRMVHQGQPHPTRPIELIAAMAVFLAWSCGWALLVEGPALFKLVVLPARHGLSPL